jgi:hypothetical protein
MSRDEWTDEIVEEVRRAREKIFREHDYDIDKLIASLQKSQERHGDRLVRCDPDKLRKIRK